MTKLRWGLVGASTIAAQHMIEAFRINGGEVVAVLGRLWSPSISRRTGGLERVYERVYGDTKITIFHAGAGTGK